MNSTTIEMTNEKRDRLIENGKLMEWTKLIEESFEFFKEYLIWLHLRK